MTTTAAAAAEVRSVIVERDVPFAPERVWRALTQPHLIEEWLMKNDFRPDLGHTFTFSGDWGSVDCKVIEVEPLKSLAYTWGGMGLDSIVTWTLTPSATGTTIRMEQAGFRPDQERAYQGARFGWANFFAKLEELLARQD